MILRIWLIIVALVAGLFSSEVFAQDSTSVDTTAKKVLIDPGAVAHQRAIARKREREQKQRELIQSDSLVTFHEKIDDRGEYFGHDRDTGGAILLKRAGELRQIENASGEVILLEHNVKIVQDSMTTWCDWARHRRSQGLLELYGDVVMVDPQRSLKGEEVFYYENERRSIARGNVILERDSTILYCEQAQYDEMNDIATFDRDLVGRDLRRSVTLTGDNGTFWTEKQHTIVPSNPVLTQYDSLGQEEARIVSEYMEYESLGGLAWAKDNVTISWHDVDGWGDELFYYPDSARALLVGEPRIEHFRDEVLGDSIWLYMNEETLDSAVVIGHSVAYTASDSTDQAPRSSLRGKRIVLIFVEGEVRQMASYGQAVGIYHVFDEGVDQGTNQVSGDLVELNLEERTLQSVRVEGGTEGTFYPPRLAGKLRDD
jgi:lipopolysaccharide export system protein LptA